VCREHNFDLFSVCSELSKFLSLDPAANAMVCAAAACPDMLQTYASFRMSSSGLPDPQVVASISSLDVARFLTSSSDASALAEALSGETLLAGSLATSLTCMRAAFDELVAGPSCSITAAPEHTPVALMSEDATRWSSLFYGRELYSCSVLADSVVVLQSSSDRKALSAAVLRSSATLLDAVFYKDEQLAILNLPVGSGERAQLSIVQLACLPFATVNGTNVLEGVPSGCRVRPLSHVRQNARHQGH
jgi:hypothetical protein